MNIKCIICENFSIFWYCYICIDKNILCNIICNNLLGKLRNFNYN